MKKSKRSFRRPGGCVSRPSRVSLYPKSSKSVTPEKTLIQSEYGQLQEMVPTLANRNHVTKRQVVTEAARYIDQLHSELVEKLHHEGLSDFDTNLAIINRLILGLMEDTVSGNKDSEK